MHLIEFVVVMIVIGAVFFLVASVIPEETRTTENNYTEKTTQNNKSDEIKEPIKEVEVIKEVEIIREVIVHNKEEKGFLKEVGINVTNEILAIIIVAMITYCIKEWKKKRKIEKANKEI